MFVWSVKLKRNVEKSIPKALVYIDIKFNAKKYIGDYVRDSFLASLFALNITLYLLDFPGLLEYLINDYYIQGTTIPITYGYFDQITNSNIISIYLRVYKHDFFRNMVIAI